MRPLTAGSRLADEWIAQLRELHSALERQPQHGLAWRWRIRAKVLTYLVLRYGDDPLLDARAFADRRPTNPNVRNVGNSRSSPLRSRRELQEILARIAEINLFKSELAPSRHDIPR